MQPPDPSRPVWAEIDLNAIRHNVRVLKSLQKSGLFCAVVKANAYGHGAVPVARAALDAGADCLAVALADEAVHLLRAGITAPLLILGYSPPEQAGLIVSENLQQTIYSFEQARILSDASLKQQKQTAVHLKVDTGMNRIGVHPDVLPDLARAVASLPGITLAGVFTHFATADQSDPSHTESQFRLFESALDAMHRQGIRPPLRHAANSAALLAHPATHLDMVRVGIALYGLWPSPDMPRPVDLRPALRLMTRAVLVKDVPAGASISYGRRHITSAPARIATLPLGYADGLSRMLTGKIHVRIHNQPAPIVGTICMDQCMADVTGIPNVSVGAPVHIFGGPDLPVEQVAAALNTINYEIVCMISSRVPRVYLQ